jgi:mannose-1-phosphate guanylyltransferase
MKAILLAAGMGTRLRPITDTVPKCLVPVQGKPLLDYWLEMISVNPQISDIYVNLHYLREVVLKHLDKHWSQNSKIRRHPEQHLLGTAGTLRALQNDLSGAQLLVIHADNLSDFCLDDFIRAHQNRPSNCLITMMLFETDSPSTCGIVELDGKARVIKMHEKKTNPPGNLANGAVYIMEPKVLEWIVNHQAKDISAEVIPAFYGQIYSWLNNGYHRDIGNPEAYEMAQREFTTNGPEPS